MNKTKTTALGVLSAEEYTAACSCAGTTVELIKPYTADDYDEQQAQHAFTIPKNLTAGCWYEAEPVDSERTGRRDLVLAQIAHRNRRERHLVNREWLPRNKERVWGCSKCGCLVAQQYLLRDAVEGADMHPS